MHESFGRLACQPRKLTPPRIERPAVVAGAAMLGTILDPAPLPKPGDGIELELPRPHLPKRSPLPPTSTPPLPRPTRNGPHLPEPSPDHHQPPLPAPRTPEAEADDADARDISEKLHLADATDIALDTFLSRVTRALPHASFVCAYGSGVFPQPSQSQSQSVVDRVIDRPMLDLIVGVDDTTRWHRDNLAINRHHYSFLRHLGPAAVAAVNDWPAHIYYNTSVELDGERVKYGVIGVDRLVDDLTHWGTLYVSGRMQKPIRILQTTGAIERAQRRNLRSALATALLLAPVNDSDQSSTLSASSLFSLIASLSYTGDVRMRIAEDPQKVEKIVQGSYHHFHRVYHSSLEQCSAIERVNEHMVRVDQSSYARASLFASVNRHLRSQVYRRSHSQVLGNAQTHSHSLAAAKDFDPPAEFDHQFVSLGRDYQRAQLAAGLMEIIGSSSASQSLKGILSAGVRKSVAYGLRKVGKALRVR